MYPCPKGVQLTRALGRGAWGFLSSRRAGTVLFPRREQPLDQLLLLPQHRYEHLSIRAFS
jgi:hypothetical protein